MKGQLVRHNLGYVKLKHGLFATMFNFLPIHTLYYIQVLKNVKDINLYLYLFKKSMLFHFFYIYLHIILYIYIYILYVVQYST